MVTLKYGRKKIILVSIVMIMLYVLWLAYPSNTSKGISNRNDSLMMKLKNSMTISSHIFPYNNLRHDKDLNSMNEKCHFHEMTRSPMNFQMCLRGQYHYISDSLRLNGFHDCDPLPSIYNIIYNKYKMNQKDFTLFFFDIGSNIGVCSFIMKSNNFTNLNIIGFEPAKSNRFYWKNTYLKNFHKWNQINNEFILFQCGIGLINNKNSIIEKTKITIVKGNEGMSKIKKNNYTLKDYDRRETYKEEICIVELDTFVKHYVKISNINYDKMLILLLKIDVEGYEYFALKSGIELIKNRKILVIKSEFAPVYLNEHGKMTAKKYLTFLDENNYDIFKKFDGSDNENPFKKKVGRDMFDKFIETVENANGATYIGKLDFFAVLRDK